MGASKKGINSFTEYVLFTIFFITLRYFNN